MANPYNVAPQLDDINMPLRLTDSELDIIFAAARPLAVQDRDPFLRDVAERLAAMPERGDGVVYQIVREIQHRHFDPPASTEDSSWHGYERAASRA
jgi:hypothetical protein